MEIKNVPPPKNLYKAIFIALFFPVLLYLIYISPLMQWIQEDHLKELKNSVPLWYLFVPVLFCSISGISIALGTPRSLIAILAGSVFGFWLALLFSEMASLIGAGIAYLYSRWARKALLAKGMDRFQGIQSHVHKHSFITVFLLRQMPVPGFLVNLFLGLLEVKVKMFFLASALGFLPQNIIFSLYGSGLKQNLIMNASLASGLLIFFSVIFYIGYQNSSIAKNLWMNLYSLKKNI